MKNFLLGMCVGVCIGIGAFYGWLYLSSLAARVTRIEQFLTVATQQ